jgi:murein DD-endopeptidase MepM/ murein hydrolase activator NlpD
MQEFKKFSSHPVIILPDRYPIYDLTQEEDVKLAEKLPYGIGRYNEKRERMYNSQIFGGKRNIHMGIDIFAPAGTQVHSFAEGEVFLFGNNSSPGDYGHTLIIRYLIGNQELYVLYGHLSKNSIAMKKEGQKVQAGEIIAWLGDTSENGGWTPHLHFQLSLVRPTLPDLPGVVSPEDHAVALIQFPDPRIVLGPIYL